MKTGGQHWFWHKTWKILILSIFLQINHTFSVWNGILCEEWFFFELTHFEITQKLKDLEFSLSVSNFLIDLQFSPFYCDFWKKNSEKGQNELDLMQAFRETWFLSKNWSRAKIGSGASEMFEHCPFLQSQAK